MQYVIGGFLCDDLSGDLCQIVAPRLVIAPSSSDPMNRHLTGYSYASCA